MANKIQMHYDVILGCTSWKFPYLIIGKSTNNYPGKQSLIENQTHKKPRLKRKTFKTKPKRDEIKGED
jgi:hypothetical protein